MERTKLAITKNMKKIEGVKRPPSKKKNKGINIFFIHFILKTQTHTHSPPKDAPEKRRKNGKIPPRDHEVVPRDGLFFVQCEGRENGKIVDGSYLYRIYSGRCVQNDKKREYRKLTALLRGE